MSVRGGLVLLESRTGKALRTVPFQYNPAPLRRIVIEAPADPAASEPGAPRARLCFELELDAADLPGGSASGVLPRLTALEQAAAESLDERERVLVLAWGARVVPVRVRSLAVEEEAFDAALDPIRARVLLELEPRGADSLPARGRRLLHAYDALRERLGGLDAAAPATLGLDARLRPRRTG